ncbi:hypothetical protein LWI29_032540 [Acer saccharum]|uniref:Peptidase A1 domain-containing protein n=1 Tax=Acer saccharum TaxID=4024 RepID=A0AA39WAD1_ACESA|nr:hypothetical protein LWI29_032540 [Acer saccharum]
MASSQNSLLLIRSLLLIFVTIIISSATAHTSFRPKALVLPVSKDSSTLQYTTQFKQRTPLVPVKLTLDLGGQFLWVDCDKGYISSTYRPVPCRSAVCNQARSKACITECFSPPRPGCNNNTCAHSPDNTVTNTGMDGGIGTDIVSLQSTDGKSSGRVVTVKKLPFTCGSTSLLEGLANGVTGMAGLGRSKISLPAQFSAAFSFPRKFAICLSSSSSENGVIFFGDGPYNFLPGTDVSKSLIYTPLILNPVSTASSSFHGDPSTDYFIGVKSIKVNDIAVKVNTSLLSINEEGFGGTKISTVNPYTVLETSIYNAFTRAFIKATANITRVSPVSPFTVCYNSKSIGFTRVGPAVPEIDLVLQNSSVVWRIFGKNSMVPVKSDVLCLGFVDGGVNPRTSIVIGGHQLEENLVQIDLAASKVGFSSILYFRQTSCSNFNFTSNA